MAKEILKKIGIVCFAAAVAAAVVIPVSLRQEANAVELENENGTETVIEADESDPGENQVDPLSSDNEDSAMLTLDDENDTEIVGIIDSEPVAGPDGTEEIIVTEMPEVEEIEETGQTDNEIGEIDPGSESELEPEIQAEMEDKSETEYPGDVEDEFEIGDENDHVYELVATHAATCSQDGEEIYTCNECGDSYALITDPATGHDVRIEQAAPTCAEDGYVRSVCDTCGEVIDEKVIAATGNHSYVITGSQAPTCVEYGWIEYECSVCGEKMAKRLDPDPEAHANITLSNSGDSLECADCGSVLCLINRIY